MKHVRVLAATAAAVLVTAAVPLIAGPAFADQGLTGPTTATTNTTQQYTFDTGGSFLLDPGAYCLAATQSSPAALAAETVHVDEPTDQITGLDATFPRAGRYTIGLVAIGLGGSCTGTSKSSSFVSGYSLTVTVTTPPSQPWKLAVSPADTTTPVGGATSFTVTLTNTAGQLQPGTPVFVSSTGRNTFTSQQVGTTNVGGQVTYLLNDTAPATSTVMTDTVTFTANPLLGSTLTAKATVHYRTLATVVAATPAVQSVTFGSPATVTVTVTNSAGSPLANVPVTVAGSGRNAFTARSAGTTDASGRVVWTQGDSAGASTLTPTATVLTFAANNVTDTATLNYAPPAPSGVTVNVTSPTQGSPISSGGYFNVRFDAAGNIPAGTVAYLTLDGAAKAQTTLTGPGTGFAFLTIPAERGNYAVRIGGRTSPLAVSAPVSLTIIPFQLNGRTGSSFRVLSGNFSAGTTVYLTRNSATVASARIPATGQPFTITAVPAPGTYQVWVASNQGRVYGAHAGVITIG